MLKIFVVLKLSVFFTLTLSGQGTKIIVDLNHPVECQKGEYKLVFQDEFEGNTLDTTKWYTFYPYGPETRPDSCAFCRTHTSANVYREQNVKVENGFLTLKSARETSNWFGAEYGYTSGMVHSKQAFTTYSKYEIRCKLPKGKHQWPAFWVFGWSTEFDVFEFICRGPRKPEFSIHKWWKSECPDQKKVSRGAPCYSSQTRIVDFGIDFSEDFHTFTLEYEPHMIKYYIDGIMIRYIPRYYDIKGRPINTCNLGPDRYLTEAAFPNDGEPVQVIASQSVCKKFKDKKVVWPNFMEVDYIRVYQKEVQQDLRPLK